MAEKTILRERRKKQPHIQCQFLVSCFTWRGVEQRGQGCQTSVTHCAQQQPYRDESLKSQATGPLCRAFLLHHHHHHMTQQQKPVLMTDCFPTYIRECQRKKFYIMYIYICLPLYCDIVNSLYNVCINIQREKFVIRNQLKSTTVCHSLPPAGWTPRKAEQEGLRTKGYDGVNPSSRAGEEEAIGFCSSSEAKIKQGNPLSSSSASLQALSRVGDGPPTREKASALLYPQTQMLISSRNTLTHMSINRF